MLPMMAFMNWLELLQLLLFILLFVSIKKFSFMNALHEKSIAKLKGSYFWINFGNKTLKFEIKFHLEVNKMQNFSKICTLTNGKSIYDK